MEARDVPDGGVVRGGALGLGGLAVRRLRLGEVDVDGLAVLLELEAGEGLYIPEGWWHRVASPEEV